MRILGLLAALALSAPALAEPPAATSSTTLSPAQAFSRAWLDKDATISFFQLALNEKLQHCVASGTITQEHLDTVRPRLELYQKSLFDGIGTVQDLVAAKAQMLLSAQDLRWLARTFSTPMFRTMRKDAMGSMSQKLVPAIPGCGDKGKQVTVSQLGAAAVPKLRPAEVAQLRVLIAAPAFQHLNRAMPQLMPVMSDGYRDVVGHALQAIGAPTAVQDKVRNTPSPVVLDPPATAPAP
jgi:hypothetical protein